MTHPSRTTALLVRAGARVCALPIASVVETMRPLPAAPLSGAPPFVRGVAIVRGMPVPVVDLEALVGGGGEGRSASPAQGRFVTIRVGERIAALAVEAVLGVTDLDGTDDRAMPLLSDACDGAVESLRARDEDLLVVLSAARLVPDEVLRAVAGQEGIA